MEVQVKVGGGLWQKKWKKTMTTKRRGKNRFAHSCERIVFFSRLLQKEVGSSSSKELLLLLRMYLRLFSHPKTHKALIAKTYDCKSFVEKRPAAKVDLQMINY